MKKYIIFTAVMLCMPLFIDVFALVPGKVITNTANCSTPWTSGNKVDIGKFQDGDYFALFKCQNAGVLEISFPSNVGTDVDFSCGSTQVNPVPPKISFTLSVANMSLTPQIEIVSVSDSSLSNLYPSFSYVDFAAKNENRITQYNSKWTVGYRNNVTFYSGPQLGHFGYAPTIKMNITGGFDEVAYILARYTCIDGAAQEAINIAQSSYNSQITNDKLNDINDTLTSPDVDSDSASGFFSGFDTEDNGGLSAIVTAPLTFVRKATSTCEPLTLKAFDKDIELPCGDTLFWNKSEVSAFRVVWNTIFGGAILFMLLRHVFKTIENVKDPQSDKVEVMKL